ncbi:sugar phosphate isomerase/epimerase family protein [Alienimonas californiensis]|uniref:Inosose dehydratase n=1 Tax=Alienimonas californiensis TaxID=2527989 RepID=A0A517PCV6_9PLAN|nr:sugar phosphate isomerase/epimerase family protein [Alienimonas californiensis]QDT17161.1 Inosose dehydratase [Alienimonas californiensis]
MSAARPRLSAFPKCYLEEISGDGGMTVFDWITEAKQLDADGLEMYEGFLPGTDDASLDRLRDAIAEAGFAMPMLCCSPDFTQPDPDDRRRAVDRQCDMIRVTRHLAGADFDHGGRPVCRVLSGQRRPEVGREEGLDWVTECLAACMPTARGEGVTLGLENHYKDGFWRFPEFAQKADVFLELLDRVPERDYFGVQFDPSNALVAGDDPVALLDRVVDRVVSMHASDRYLVPGASLDDLRQADGTLGYSPDLMHGVTGKGLNDYDALFSRLSASGYDGWISIEDGMNGLGEMAESLSFLRRMVAKHWGD